MVMIKGTGCSVDKEDGDGVVSVAQATLPGIQEYTVAGTCDDFFGVDHHTEILNIDKHPEVYEIIKKALK
jgi:hypothetical protein